MVVFPDFYLEVAETNEIYLVPRVDIMTSNSDHCFPLIT